MDLKQFIEDTRRKLNSIERRLNRLSAAGGEANTASNVGAGGEGLFKQKTGVNLEFRNINAGSAKILVALDAPNNEVDIDIGKFNLDDLDDVNAPAPNDDDVLTWDDGAGAWVPAVGGGGGGGAENNMAHRRVGRYYSSDSVGTQTAWANNILMEVIYAVPFIVPISQDFDRIAIYVPWGTINGVARIGIYEDDGDVYPGDLVIGTAEFDCSGAGVKEEMIAETLNPGLYWLAIVAEGDSNVAINCHYGESRNCVLFPILGWKAGLITSPGVCFYTAQAYGAMPDPFPAINGEIEETTWAPAIYLRRT